MSCWVQFLALYGVDADAVLRSISLGGEGVEAAGPVWKLSADSRGVEFVPAVQVVVDFELVPTLGAGACLGVVAIQSPRRSVWFSVADDC